MTKLINIDEKNVAWVETDEGCIFGIVNAFEVLDSEGVDLGATDVLEDDFEIDQDWEREANLITFREENGESYQLVITADSVELEDL